MEKTRFSQFIIINIFVHLNILLTNFINDNKCYQHRFFGFVIYRKKLKAINEQ